MVQGVSRVRTAAVVLAMATFGVLGPASAEQPATTSTISPKLAAIAKTHLTVPEIGGAPDSLVPGEVIASPSGRFALVMQRDGNLVEYNPRGFALWASGTEGNRGSHLELRQGGGLYIVNPEGQDVWAAGSISAPLAVLGVSDSAVVTISGPRVTWSNDAADNRLYPPAVLTPSDWISEYVSVDNVAVMQRDGNFVLYNNKKARWATGTEDNSGAYLTMQRDGNLVVYSATGAVLWASSTFAPDARLTLWSGGLQVVNQANQALWHSA